MGRLEGLLDPPLRSFAGGGLQPGVFADEVGEVGGHRAGGGRATFATMLRAH